MATGSTHPISVPGEAWRPRENIDYEKPEIDYEKFVTEDDKPVDSIYSERQHTLLTVPLNDCWPGPGDGRPFLVCTDVGLFYSDTEPAFAPDVLLSLDVSPPQGNLRLKENRSYYIWKYKAPDALIEVVSNREGGELTTKLKGYARLRASYYIVWDPHLYLGDKQLYCFALHEGNYKPCEPRFREIGLGVKTWNGTYAGMPATFLRWCDLEGNLIPTGGERVEQEMQRVEQEKQRVEQEKQRVEQEKQRVEQEKQRAEQEKQRAEQEKQRAEQEKQRAEQEKQRAEQEKQRAEQEKQRADKLAEKLRAAGIDPDKP